ncbi:hypothetical protein ACN47E_000089 [Coniothyrium glycines]
MAPSMLNYLRPGHAKRNVSSLASPEPVPSPAAHPLPSPSHNSEYFSSPRFSETAGYASASPISPFPPQLPPIARVASKLDRSASATSTQHTPSHTSASAADRGSPMAQDRAMLSPPQRPQPQKSPSFEPPAGRPWTAHTPAGLRPSTQRADSTYQLETQSQSTTHLAPAILSPNYASMSRSQTSLMSGTGDKLSSNSRNTSTPTPTPAKNKSRLNLRNPMSLLMRRRSGPALDPLQDESLVTHRSPPSRPTMLDNYDPSIRGNIVHDFNAPRLNRNFSYSNAYGSATQPDLGRVSPPKIDREHTPVFHEHFDDDTTYEQSQAAIRAEQLANKDFLARNSFQSPPPEQSPLPPLPPPKKTPPPAVQQPLAPPVRPPFQAFDSGSSNMSSILSPVQENPDALDGSAEVLPRNQKSTKTPPPARSRATSVVDPSFQPAGLPAHFSSRASRFSFQIPGGSDSAEEKLLEDRHKAKAAEKASKAVRQSTNSIEDEYDEYGMDMDDYDVDGDFDEEIPMLGEEDEFQGLGDQTLDSGPNAFDFSSTQSHGDFQYLIPSSDAANYSQASFDTTGNPIGFAMSEDMIQQLQGLGISRQTDPYQDAAAGAYGIDSEDSLQEQRNESSSLNSREADIPAPPAEQLQEPCQLDMDDDMYFDDGLIGDQEVADTFEFDENVFDDPDGPLYERKVKFSELDDHSTSQSMVKMQSETGYEADDDTVTKHLLKSEPSLAHKTSIAQQRSGPTFDTMDAYHSALADAANRAEASGRFTRKASVDAAGPSSDQEDYASLSHSRPSLVPDDGRVSLDTDVYPPEDDLFGMSSGFVDDYDYSDFDSALEDDPIIAAANAEALAYDDEGFYGQEFGFYASANGESPSAWGGVFGPSGLGRTVSGRNAVREPNLTPITERSEYSTRNSFISLNHFRDGQQPISSPGLVQLARMSPYGWPGEEEDMSLDALMKLRKGAFGGSAPSLPASTSGSPRNSSPMGMQFVPRSSSPMGNRMKEHTESEHESAGSLGLVENEEEDDDGRTDAVNAPSDDDHANVVSEERSESPTLASTDSDSLSSSVHHMIGSKGPLLAPISELYAHNMVSLSHMNSPLSQGGITLTSSSNVSIPMSPFGGPLPSPFLAQQMPSAPPSIDTSLSSPAATVSSSSAPRRQSMGLISPISNSSPITPNGSGWRGGHSRKGSAADSINYVREHDEAGEGRWVLERRRTAESGELELIGREIVEGGRI